MILRPSGIFLLSSIRSCDFISDSYIKVLHFSYFDKIFSIVFFANFYTEFVYFKAALSGYWTIQAQLFTTNGSSKALFDALGFREVGIRKNIGKLGDEWIDNYLLEKVF